MYKFRSVFPISVQFAAGEEPSGPKLTAFAKQTKQGLGLLEYAIGDIWNQSGDALLGQVAKASIMVPSLAGYVGPSRVMGPRIPALSSITSYTQTLVTTGGGPREYLLPFPPAPGTTWSFNYTASGLGWINGGAPTLQVASRDLIQSAGNWWADATSGRLVLYNVVTSNVSNFTVTYIPLVYGDEGVDARACIVPDIDTLSSYGFQSLKLQYKNGVDGSAGYYVYLPPRGPLNTRYYPSDAPNGAIVPDDTTTKNFSVSPSTECLFWQSDSIAADDTSSNRDHYRYNLPKIITDNFYQNAPLPTGYLYLYDSSGTGTIIEGLAFTADPLNSAPRKYAVLVTGSNLTTWLTTPYGATLYPDAALKSSSHSKTYYPTGGLRLLTVGTDLSHRVDLLDYLYHSHTHNGSDSTTAWGTRELSHSDLKGLLINPVAPSCQPRINYSPITGDDHSQYLERHGYNTSRDQYNNMMLGDIVLSSTSSASNYENYDARSNALRFGEHAGGAALYTMPWSGYFGVPIMALDLPDGGGSYLGHLRVWREKQDYGLLDFLLSNNSTTNNQIISDQDLTISRWYSSNPPIQPLANFTLASGLQLTQSTATYQVAPRTDWISVPLGPGAAASRAVPDGDHWVLANYTDGSATKKYGWISQTLNDSIVFYITDLPNYCIINAISFGYLASASSAPIVVSAKIMDWSQSSTIYTLFSPTTLFWVNNTWETGGGSVGEPVPCASNSFARASQVLQITAVCGGTPGIVGLLPVVRIQCSYASVSPWQPLF